MTWAETGRGDLKRLRGSDPAWHLRVGDDRVKLAFDYSQHRITVLWILPGAHTAIEGHLSVQPGGKPVCSPGALVR